MTDRELMQTVLNKLDHIWELGVEVGSYKLSDDLLFEIKALRERLSQPDWVGLTDEDWRKEKHEASFIAGVQWAEARLKEKNT